MLPVARRLRRPPAPRQRMRRRWPRRRKSAPPSAGKLSRMPDGGGGGGGGAGKAAGGGEAGLGAEARALDRRPPRARTALPPPGLRARRSEAAERRARQALDRLQRP